MPVFRQLELCLFFFFWGGGGDKNADDRFRPLNECIEQVHALRVELSQTQSREKDAKDKANKFREEIDVIQGIRSELEEKLAQLEMKSNTQIDNLREELRLTEGALELAQKEREGISQTLHEVEEKFRKQQGREHRNVLQLFRKLSLRALFYHFSIYRNRFFACKRFVCTCKC